MISSTMSSPMARRSHLLPAIQTVPNDASLPRSWVGLPRFHYRHQANRASSPSAQRSARSPAGNCRSPSSLVQRLVSIVDVFLTGGLGASAIAATGLGQLLMVTTMTVFWGLSTGVTVVISHLWGAGRREDAGRAAYVACLAGLALTAICSLAG